MDCEEYLLKSEHIKGKIFTKFFRFVKFAKIFPLENNPLYGNLSHTCVRCTISKCVHYYSVLSISINSL